MKHYPLLSHLDYDTLVLANGAYPKESTALSLIEAWAQAPEDRHLVCCDGAVNKLLSLQSVLPNKVVGDLDSISPQLRSLLGDRLIQVKEQESNDLSKTMRYIHSTLGLRSIVLLGATGEREDHTLGNLSLLPSYAPLVEELVLMTDTGYFRLITEASTMEVVPGSQISFFNFERSPISVRGVHWALEQHILPYLWSGTLNRANSSTIYIEAPNPILVFVAYT